MVRKEGDTCCEGEKREKEGVKRINGREESYEEKKGLGVGQGRGGDGWEIDGVRAGGGGEGGQRHIRKREGKRLSVATVEKTEDKEKKDTRKKKEKKSFCNS